MVSIINTCTVLRVGIPSGFLVILYQTYIMYERGERMNVLRIIPDTNDRYAADEAVNIWRNRG